MIESAPAGTRYVDVYRDAMEHGVGGRDTGVILVDHDRLVGSLADNCAVDDEPYQSLHRRARAQMQHNNGQVTVKLMVQLVRQAIVVARGAAARHAGDAADVVLTGFFDLSFMTGFSGAGFKTTAVVELSCGKIRSVREKFESRATVARRAVTAAAIRRFWTGFREALDTADGAAAFQDVVVYRHECQYDARREPLDCERIIAGSAEFVLRDVASVWRLVSDVSAECEKFTVGRWPRTYALVDVNDAESALRSDRAYGDRMARFPDAAVTVALVVDAILRAIDPDRLGRDWVDDYFDALTDDGDRGCADSPACVQYGDGCGLAAKRHKLQRTDYARSAVNVMRARWKRSLWGRRPLLTPRVEAEYGDAVAAIKRRLGRNNDDDGVDAQLCILGLNRLQGNLDVFRGEPIELYGLGVTDVTFRPTVIEPVGCTTMVQMLDKQATTYRRMGHAYFEPEDMVLVGFYDFHPMATTLRSSFDAVIPQRPVGVRDYFDFFHGKRPPKCFYAMATTASLSPMMMYHENTDEKCFKNGDILTMAQRKWRFEPGVVCLTYKSERYEIIRHVVDDDRDGSDRLRIYTGSGGEYCVDKSCEGVIGFTGTVPDGGRLDVFTQNSGRAVCLLRQPGVGVAGRDTVEMSRLCGDGCVTIEFADQCQIRYSAVGGVTEKDALGTRVLHGRSKGGKMRGIKSQSENRKNRVTRSPVESRKSRVLNSSSVSRRSSKNVAAMKSPVTKSKATPTRDSNSETGTDSENALKPESDMTAVVVENSRDGTRRTVTFADGTTITTNFRRAQRGKPRAALAHELLDVTSYEYAHPAYLTVTDDRDAGTISVFDVVTRSEDGALQLPRWPKDPGCVEITAAAIVVRDGAESCTEPVATFGWTATGDRIDCVNESLFEKRDGRRHVSAIARRHPGKPHREVMVIDDDREASVAGVADSVSILPRPAAYFIVKRGMSGFAVPGPRRYHRFVEDIRGRRGTAINEQGREIVALFVHGDVDRNLGAESDASTATASARHFAWLHPSFAREFPGPVGTTTAADGIETLLADLRKSDGRLQLVSRAFRKVDVDYGPVLDALRRLDYARPLPTARLPVVRMRARAYVPDLDDVKAAYVTVSPVARVDVMAAVVQSEERERRRARLRASVGHAHQALSRLASNSFIPYFHRDSYEPLRDSWLL